ncbi:hypothetical protein B0A48_14858 [Cryoendolithus antarcticus]|uniref:Uncharacterized protein n=1 Tax=Cryoendolithus antarcticus TaxID=1507870 RepID=A0A1V8SIX7_9PEZI|nr:hypothetical protein B0A48_14858 [Cryoendolithus antarcticus]
MRKTCATPALDELADAAKFKIAASFLTLPTELRFFSYNMVAVRNLALSAEERQSCKSEIREKHKDTQQRLEDLKALLFFAGWMGQALFYWPRAFPGPYDEDENLDMLMVFGDNKDDIDDKL